MRKYFIIVLIVVIAAIVFHIYSTHRQKAPEPAMPEKQAAQDASVQPETDGDKFLAENKSRPQVITLPSGLQYRIITEGNGAKPTLDDSVTVDYEGHFVDGRTFDSTYQAGAPITFLVKDVIKGWQEALQLMAVGSTWELYIPADLAYGETGAPPIIGPNEVLIFKVQLISINKSS